jgi:hypothetical protein
VQNLSKLSYHLSEEVSDSDSKNDDDLQSFTITTQLSQQSDEFQVV